MEISLIVTLLPLWFTQFSGIDIPDYLVVFLVCYNLCKSSSIFVEDFLFLLACLFSLLRSVAFLLLGQSFPVCLDCPFGLMCSFILAVLMSIERFNSLLTVDTSEVCYMINDV